MYEIDRKTASRLLKVSMRTIDRYIAKSSLSFEKRDGRIWLDKKEVMKIRQQRKIISPVRMSTPRMSIDSDDVIPVDMSIDDGENVYNQNPQYSHVKREIPVDSTSENDDGVYKRLFEELQKELKEKQERLEGANYRVGQLESHLKESVPLLEYNREIGREREEKENMRKNLDAQQFETEQILNALKEERFNKKVYLIILFILLLLQPLWFFFPVN